MILTEQEEGTLRYRAKTDPCTKDKKVSYYADDVEALLLEIGALKEKYPYLTNKDINLEMEEGYYGDSDYPVFSFKEPLSEEASYEKYRRDLINKKIHDEDKFQKALDLVNSRGNV